MILLERKDVVVVVDKEACLTIDDDFVSIDDDPLHRMETRIRLVIVVRRAE